MLSAALLGLALAGSGEQPEQPEAETPEAPAQTKQRGWVQLSPAGLARPGPRVTPDLRVFDTAVRAGYRWGLAAGMMFEPIDHLLLGATASVEQNIWSFADDLEPSYELCFADGCWGWRERGVGYLLRFGGDLRVGWTSRWLMAWTFLSLQLSLSHIRLECDNSVEAHCTRSENDLGPGLGGGGGFALRVAEGLALGVEGSIDHAWLDTRDDPFTAVRTWDVALVGIVRF